MEFSAFFIFVVFTASMNYLFGEERKRAMLFPDYYFFDKRRLVNHTIELKYVKNLDECELLCYQNDNCVSLSYKKDSDTNPKNNETVHICKLNDATHLKYDGDLRTDANFYYRGSKNACDNNPQCQNNATCQSGFTLKGYRCLCPPGFKGEHCENDINECKTPGKCHANATCNNTHGSYLCTCKPGYTGHGQNCSDMDECTGNHSCHVNATCKNTLGSHVCNCDPGYTGNGKHCTDIDECTLYPGKCHVHGTCTNTHGSFGCTCMPGHTGDGQTCTDVDECKGNHSCHESGSCTNTIGSHVCECYPGYNGNGRNCIDIDECSEAHADQKNKCHANASCINTQGSYNCSCNTNYIGDGFKCEADSCIDYKELSDANRKKSSESPNNLCDTDLAEGWYRFVGAAGTQMPTTRVPGLRCGTVHSGWLFGTHPTMEDGTVSRKVCFSHKRLNIGCERTVNIGVKQCGSYYLYKLVRPPKCNMRYCGTD